MSLESNYELFLGAYTMLEFIWINTKDDIFVVVLIKFKTSQLIIVQSIMIMLQQIGIVYCFVVFLKAIDFVNAHLIEVLRRHRHHVMLEIVN